jgi:hypothetical protein
MKIAVLDNGPGNLQHVYDAERFPGHSFSFIPALRLAHTDLAPFDVFIAPNGTDHVALFGSRDKVRTSLEGGGIVMCFCGWVTDWIPGARWRMSTDIPLRTYGLSTPNPAHPLLHGVDLASVNVTPAGKRGFWACGHIDVSPGAAVLMADNLGRCVMFADDTTFAGAVIATASGPLPGFGDDGAVFDRLFANALSWSESRRTMFPRG